jgi:mannosyl-3-phosphoglycerate phosphatase
MFAPRQVIFSVVEGVLDPPRQSAQTLVFEALDTLARHNVPLVLCGRGTRAELEPLRRKLQHAHPFITENGGGLFIPDGYFNLHLEGAIRAGRYFCVPFARPHVAAATAVQEIAEPSGAGVVRFSEMSAREIASNSGISPKEAELCRQREFSEIFFFTGEADRAAARFSEIARAQGWEAITGNPFWQLRALVRRNGELAPEYLMGLYRKSFRSKLRSVSIGTRAEDLHLLSGTDIPVVLPQRPGVFDEAILSRLPQVRRGDQAGPAGWAQAIRKIVETPEAR